MKFTMFLIINVLWLSSLQLAFAGKADIQAGKLAASNCQGCHGPKGISPVPNYPNLAGQQIAYFIKAMNDYKNGDRKDSVMNGVVGSLAENDIKNLAAFYASLPVK